MDTINVLKEALEALRYYTKGSENTMNVDQLKTFNTYQKSLKAITNIESALSDDGWVSIKVKPKRTGEYLLLYTYFDNNTESIGREIAMYFTDNNTWVRRVKYGTPQGYMELPIENPKLPIQPPKSK